MAKEWGMPPWELQFAWVLMDMVEQAREKLRWMYRWREYMNQTARKAKADSDGG